MSSPSTGPERGNYWSVDIPGLTEAQAASLASISREKFGIRGSPIDPAQWLTLHLDRATAIVLRDALRPAASGDIGVGFLEILTEWIDSTSEDGTDED